MNGIIYCRVSSKEQTEGTSLESQELACREYAKSKNINVLRIFVERGESAKFADRTQLLGLLEFVRASKGQVRVLLVWKVDRFARNVADHFSIKAALLKYGVRVVSVTEPIDTNPEGKLMETILAGFAQFDNDIRAARTVQGLRRRLQEGISPFHPPLGYRNSNRRGDKKSSPDVPEQPLFELLQKAWKEAATGAHTKAGMRRLMTSWGILTRKGRPLTPQTIDNFFRNRYYAGTLIDPWSNEEYRGRHVPMVTEAEFAKVQEVFARRSHSIPHQLIRPEFPLRGLVRCGSCQRFLTGSFAKGRSHRYPYYHCFNRQCLRRRSYPAPPIHEEFEAFLGTIAPKPELLERVAALVLRIAEERRSLRTKSGAQRANALRRLKREGEELVRMRAQGLITDEEFMAHKAALRDRQTAMLGRTQETELNPADLSRDLEEIKDPLYKLPDTWRTIDTSRRLRFERLILPAGFVNERIRTAELGLLFRVFGQSAAHESSLVALVRKSWNQTVAEIRGFTRLLAAHEESGEELQHLVRKKSPRVTPRDELEPEQAAA
jgi:site-specific DNA recombinase